MGANMQDLGLQKHLELDVQSTTHNMKSSIWHLIKIKTNKKNPLSNLSCRRLLITGNLCRHPAVREIVHNSPRLKALPLGERLTLQPGELMNTTSVRQSGSHQL